MNGSRENQGPVRRLKQVKDSDYTAVSEGRIRIRIGAVIFMFALMVAVVRMAEVSLLSPSNKSFYPAKSGPVTRADIVDRNGVLLASTIEGFDLYINRSETWNPSETATKISELFEDLDAESLSKRIQGGRGQFLVRRGLTPAQKREVFALGLPGTVFQGESRRFYPQGHLASHIVGFSDVDMNGIAGAERAFNDLLTEDNAPSLALSIDLRVQNAVAEELSNAIDRFGADTGAAIVMNMNTGEILAMVSLPNFDPNAPGTSSPQNLYNHASMSTYELGSVFKPITMAMALEAGVTDLEETFPVQDPLKVRDRFIRDDHPSKIPLAMPEILAESSNRGTALMAMRVGGDGQRDFLRKLGLMERVPIELVESAAPQVQREWQDITTVTVSYGHGISVTPLALTAATSALLNGGEYVAPTLRRQDSVTRSQRRRVISQDTSRTLRDLMRYVATDGTGRNAAVEGYSVMGKTGTADKPSGDGYDERRLVSSFIAGFPYENPQYTVFVTLDEPKAIEGTYGYATAGWNAAPTTGKIIERIAPMLGVQRHIGAEPLSPFSKTEPVR